MAPSSKSYLLHIPSLELVSFIFANEEMSHVKKIPFIHYTTTGKMYANPGGSKAYVIHVHFTFSALRETVFRKDK